MRDLFSCSLKGKLKNFPKRNRRENLIEFSSKYHKRFNLTFCLFYFHNNFVWRQNTPLSLYFAICHKTLVGFRRKSTKSYRQFIQFFPRSHLYQILLLRQHATPHHHCMCFLVLNIDPSAISMLLTPSIYNVLVAKVSCTNPKLNELIWKKFIFTRVTEYRSCLFSSTFDKG